MKTCNLPPEGWSCSRKPGHKGPCAALPEKPPYDTYADKVLSDPNLMFGIEIHTAADLEREDWENATARFSKGELRGMLADAWIAGLEHALTLLGRTT